LGQIRLVIGERSAHYLLSRYVGWVNSGNKAIFDFASSPCSAMGRQGRRHNQRGVSSEGAGERARIGPSRRHGCYEHYHGVRARTNHIQPSERPTFHALPARLARFHNACTARSISEEPMRPSPTQTRTHADRAEPWTPQRRFSTLAMVHTQVWRFLQQMPVSSGTPLG
jgi:hypothetical protein